MRSLGGWAEALASPLEQVSAASKKAQKGLKIASIGSDINQTLESVKEFKDETLPEIQEQLEETLETIEKLGLKEKFFGSTFKTLNTSATVLSATTKGATKNLSDLFLKFAKFMEVKGYVSAIATGFIEMNRTLNDTYRAVEEFDELGIDTTFQKSALSVGVFGQKLLFSAEAAKQFRRTAIAAFAQLQDRLAYLTTLSTAAEQGQRKLGQSILDLTNGPLKNAISALDVTTGYYDAISAGQQSVDFLNASMKFSVATGASAADSIGALAQVHNIYRLNARDAAKTAALFNATIENGVVNGAQMASGIGQLASVAKSAGIDLIELNAMFAALTKNGFQAADAFQGLMSLITSIAGQGSESAKAAQELGIRFDFARIKAEGLVTPINELYAATGGSVSKMKTIVPDALAFRTAMALATNASKDFLDVSGKMENLDTSSLDTVFDRRRDSIAQRTEALKNGFQNEIIAYGEALQGTMEPVIATSERLLEWFENLSSVTKGTIITATKLNIGIEKITQTANIAVSVFGNLVKTLVVARAMLLATGLVMGGPGRKSLLTIIDLVKNQKDYTKALTTFLGVTDKVGNRIEHLTKLERSQLKVSRQLLNQRKQSVTQLSRLMSEKGSGGAKGLDMFSDRELKSNIDKAFKNAVPQVKAKATEIRRTLQEQFAQFKAPQTNLLLRQLGITNLKNTEADLERAGRAIAKFKDTTDFTNATKSQQYAMQQQLAYIQSNIVKRKELLALTQSQMAVEKSAVNSLNQQIMAATGDVKGDAAQGKQIIQQAAAAKYQQVRGAGTLVRKAMTQINGEIAQDMQKLSPNIAQALAGRQGTELDTAIKQLKGQVSGADIARLDNIERAVEARKMAVAKIREQTKAISVQHKALNDATKGQKMSALATAASVGEVKKLVEARTQQISKLKQINKLDFLQVVSDQNLVNQVNSAFNLADKQVQKRAKKLANDVQKTSGKIFDSTEASSLSNKIGLTDAKNTAQDLDRVTEKLNEVKKASKIDPKVLALTEANIKQRQALIALSAQQATAHQVESASLDAQTAALTRNNMERAKAMGFKGPLAEMNQRYVAGLLDIRDGLSKYSQELLKNNQMEKISWISREKGAGAAQRAAMATKLQTMWTGISGKTSIIAAGGVKLFSAALEELWLMTGPLVLTIGALVAAFMFFGKIKAHHDMLDKTTEKYQKLKVASVNFEKQVTAANGMKNLARDLREYYQELEQTSKNSKILNQANSKSIERLNALSELNIETLEKTGKEYDTLRKVSLPGYADRLDKTADAFTNFKSAGDEAFDSVAVQNTVAQSKAIASELRRLAANARLAGENLEAIKLERFAEEAEAVVKNADNIQEQFESSLSDKQRKRYQKRQAKLEKEKRFKDMSNRIRRKTITESLIGQQGDLASAIEENLIRGGVVVDSINADIDRIKSGGILGKADSEAEKILQAAKKNKARAALDSNDFKKLQQEERELLEQKSKAIDNEIEKLQTLLEEKIENKTITTDEIIQEKKLIALKKEANSEREEEFKLMQKRQREAQAALAAIDLNDAGTSIVKLNENIEKAKLQVLQDTASETTIVANQKIFDDIKNGVITSMSEIPENLKTQAVKSFEGMVGMFESEMNTATAYQRRQLAVFTNDLGALVTSLNNVDAGGLEAVNNNFDRTIQNLDKILAVDAIKDPAVLAKLSEQIASLKAQVALTGDEGVAYKLDLLEQQMEFYIKSFNETARRRVEINQRAIAEISHLESLGLIDSFQAAEERLELEVANNREILNITNDRYEYLAKKYGSTSKRALAAYQELIEAERTLAKSQFMQKREAEARKLKKITGEINRQVEQRILDYQRELDRLELITDEYRRQQRLIDLFTQGFSQTFSFLDNINESITKSITDSRAIAQFQERAAKRRQYLLDYNQKREVEALVRQKEQLRLSHEEAVIQNEIAIANKEREITLAKLNFKQEQRNRKLRKSEILDFNLKLEQMDRERSQLDRQGEKLERNYQSEKRIATENELQLKLKHEQADNGGLLDIIDAKLSGISAKYQEQTKIASAMKESFNGRLGFTEKILGLVGRLTTDEKEQKRLAQIAAQTKLKSLQQQQELEKQSLQLQQKQQAMLLKQEQIKIRMLGLQQKIAIAEDTRALQKAKATGDKDAQLALEEMLASRAEIVGNLNATNKGLRQQQQIQEGLRRSERQQLELKQQGDRLEARVEVNQTRPDGRRKEIEARQLRREMLSEVSLNLSQIIGNKANLFNAPTAKLPKGVRLELPKEVNVEKITQDAVNQYFTKLGIKPLDLEDDRLNKDYNKARNSVLKPRQKTLIDFVDPGALEQFKQFYDDTVSIKNAIANKDEPQITAQPAITGAIIDVATKVATPTVESIVPVSNSIAIAREQLNVQQQLVEEIRKQQRKVEMFNEVNLVVNSTDEASQNIEDVVLNTFDRVLSEAENK